jgi:hypothetical protein
MDMAMQVKNNTPQAGYIQWSDVNISYKGQVHRIADGSTNFIYVFWKYSDPTSFYGSNAFPTLGDDDLLVFLNKSGIHVKVPTATVLDGSLIVPESILTDALSANVITSEKIATDSINARHIEVGSLTAELFASGLNPNIVGNSYDSFAQIPEGAGNVARTAGTTLTIEKNSLGLTSGKVLRVQDSTGYLAKDTNDFSITVTAGKKYIVSAYVRNDTFSGNNNNTLGLRFNNTAKDIYAGVVPVMGNSGWVRIMVAVTAPTGATKAMLYVSSVRAHLWDAFMVEQVESFQTQASAWRPAGTTVIWGGNIAAKSIKTESLDVQKLSALTADLGDMTTGSLKLSAINGSSIEIRDGFIKTIDVGGSYAYDFGTMRGFYDQGGVSQGEFGLSNYDMSLGAANNLYLSSWFGNITLSASRGITVNSDITGGTVYMNNWFRAKGQTGLYFQDYGGGFYQTEEYWVRVYGGKNLLIPSGNLGVNRIVGDPNGEQIWLGWGNSRIDTGGDFARWQASPTQYIRQNKADGTVQILANDLIRHIFYNNGTKSGGSIEVDGKNLGMSPIDSPQVLLEYIEFDIPLTPEGTKVLLDDTYLKTVEGFAVFPNNGVIVEKGLDYFIIKGEGLADCRIVGERIEYKGKFYDDLTDLTDEGDVGARELVGQETEN